MTSSPSSSGPPWQPPAERTGAAPPPWKGYSREGEQTGKGSRAHGCTKGFIQPKEASGNKPHGKKKILESKIGWNLASVQDCYLWQPSLVTYSFWVCAK